MAMEERQRQIKEGAGLEESRLNTEFIDMMKKWGPHLITVVAILAGLWAARDWWNRKVETRADDAFASFEKALPKDNSPVNPAVFEQIAVDHATGTAVPLEARSVAAAIHMEAARTGIPIGEKLTDGKLPEGKNFLTAEEKKAELTKAEGLFQTILSSADSSIGQTNIAIGALTGLAAIAEDRAEFDKAKGFYQQAATKAADKKLEQLEKLIKNRLDTLDKLKNPPRLYASTELPGGGEKPVVAPMGGIIGKTASGETIQLGGPSGTSGTVQIPGGSTLVPAGPPTITTSGGSRPATPDEIKKNAPPTATPAPAPTPAPEKPAETPKPAAP
jgi:predicted negative regulator of RcsB-dependent stress response